MSAAPGFFSNPIKSTPGMSQYDTSNAMTRGLPSAGATGGNNNIGQVYQDMGQNYQQFGQAYQQATQAADQLKNSYSVNQQQMNQYLTALQGALGGMSTANMNTGGNNPGFGDVSHGNMMMPGFQKYTPEQLANPGQYINAGPPSNMDTSGLSNNLPPMSKTMFQDVPGGIIFPTYNNAVGAVQELYNLGQQGLGGTGEQALQAGQQGLINAQTQFMTGTIAPTYQGAVAGATGLYGAPSTTPQDFYNQYSNVIFGQPGSAYTPNFQG